VQSYDAVSVQHSALAFFSESPVQAQLSGALPRPQNSHCSFAIPPAMRALNPSVASRGFGDDAMNCNESPGNGTHNAGVSLSALVQAASA